MCAIPNNMTNFVQPLDLSVNRSFKSYLRHEAQSCYSLEIEKQLKDSKQAHEIKVDIQISVMKPLHAKWIVLFYYNMKNHNQIILAGWRKSKL